MGNFALHPLISKFRKFPPFCLLVKEVARCRHVEFATQCDQTGQTSTQVVVRAQKTPLLPIVGVGMWRPFGEMTRTFAALLSARKRPRKN